MRDSCHDFRCDRNRGNKNAFKKCIVMMALRVIRAVCIATCIFGSCLLLGDLQLVWYRVNQVTEGLLRRYIGTIQSLIASTALYKRERQAQIRMSCLKDMPTMLDILTLGLSSGLSFDASLEMYCQRSRGELAKQMNESLNSWRLGVVSREKALKEQSAKIEIAAFNRFANTVSESLIFGAPLSQTLEHQAQLIRQDQQIELEEKLEKLPVKMLIPLTTLIVPAMLIVILGPILSNAMN